MCSYNNNKVYTTTHDYYKNLYKIYGVYNNMRNLQHDLYDLYNTGVIEYMIYVTKIAYTTPQHMPLQKIQLHQEHKM